jgi:putative ABC transport system permease protein
MAEIFFGSPDRAMGNTIRYENNYDFVVTAVFENVPRNSTLQFDFIFNLAGAEENPSMVFQ